MRIAEVDINNLCQHRSRCIEFHPGLNLIVGPNGSGKSNILKMIYGAFTNDFSRNQGVLLQNISQLAGPKEPAGIEVTFEHNQVTAKIERNLRPSRKSLQIPGKKTETKDADINQGIFGFLGVNEQILDEYVFVDQWKIFSFLDQTSAKRAAAFQRLFDTQHAEKCYDEIGESLGRIEVRSCVVAIDESRRSIASAREGLQREEELYQGYADLPASSEEAVKEDRQIVADYARSVELSALIKRREATIESLRSRQSGLKNDLAGFSSDLAVLLAAVEGGDVRSARAQQSLSAWLVYRRTLEFRAKIDQTLASLEESRAKIVEPLKPADYFDLRHNSVDRDTMMLSVEVARLKKFIENFNPALGKSICPECESVVSSEDFRERWEVAKVSLAEKSSALAKRQDQVRLSLGYDRDFDRYSSQKGHWEKCHSDARKQLADLKDSVPPRETEDELKKVLEDHKQVTTAINEINVEVSRIEGELSTVARQLEAEERFLEEDKKKYSTVRSSHPDQVEAAKMRIEQTMRRYEDKARIGGAVQSMRQGLQARLAELQRLEEEQKRSEKKEAWAGLLGEYRAVLHRNGLPQIVAQHYLSSLEKDINDYLDYFEAPFRVSASPDLSFEVSFFFGPKAGVSHSAGRLSGGEKVVMAMAFRLSVNSMFAGEVGLLCLDEPTAGLDDHNLGCLEAALNRLRELSRTRSLQVILVTHERGLRTLADRVIDLGGWQEERVEQEKT